jgi:hypothetical protein
MKHLVVFDSAASLQEFLGSRKREGAQISLTRQVADMGDTEYICRIIRSIDDAYKCAGYRVSTVIYRYTPGSVVSAAILNYLSTLQRKEGTENEQ